MESTIDGKVMLMGKNEGEETKIIKVDLTTQSEWARGGTRFYSQTRSDKNQFLPSGVYQYESSLGSWWLERTAPFFTFPFKVYNASDDIISRIVYNWQINGGNLGVLMNGLRGAGKTMTAQLIANKLIEEEQVPVLVVRQPVPLQTIFDSVKQHMVVIFDEFEKTHDDENQQMLLSTIDGMSRSENNRLIIFTTNNTTINENFRDRPSRIHYRFEFSRVADEIIDGLIDDSLPEDLIHFKQDIFDFLNSRKICTIDIVKAVISEVKTFRESPTQFENLLNVAESEPPSYKIEIINEKTGMTQVFSSYFRLDRQSKRHSSLINGNKRSVEDFVDKQQYVTLYSNAWEGQFSIRILEKVEEEEGMWLAMLSAPLSRTIWREFESIVGNHSLYLDNKPKDWDFPFSKSLITRDAEAHQNLVEKFDRCLDYSTVYGTMEPAIFKIRISVNREWTPSPSRFVANGDQSGFIGDRMDV